MELIIVFVLIVIWFFWRQSLEIIRKKISKSEIELYEELKQVKSELNELRDKVECMSLSEDEKEKLAFENAPDLPLLFFEKLEKGQVISLMSGSYYYPSEDIYINKFQYKHDYIDQENKTEYGYEIHGFENPYDDEWFECTFRANEKECKTEDCAGTVKRASSEWRKKNERV